MKVEQIKDNGEEVRLRVSASAAEMSKAFTDGLDAFVVQYQMDQLEGESSLEKINNALGEEDGKAAVYNAVINYLVPFALEKQGTMPVSTYGIESDETPEPDKMFSFDMTVLVKPEFELSSYKPVKVEMSKSACWFVNSLLLSRVFNLTMLRFRFLRSPMSGLLTI